MSPVTAWMREQARKWLVVGIGGGGDVYGCLPLRWELLQAGCEVRLGSLTWERSVVDPRAGPRRIAELTGVEPVGEFGALGGPHTETRDGIVFQATRLSRFLDDEPVLFLDIGGGARGVRAAVTEYCTREGITGVLGVDVGGDVVAAGPEPGLHSPLADATLLAALGQLADPVTPLVGVFGMNADGELTQAELLARFSHLTPHGYVGAIGHGADAFAQLRAILADPQHVTEASRQPLRAWQGEHGATTIRRSRRHVELNLLLTVTFLFDARGILPECPLAWAIRDTTSVLEADARIREDFRINTEYHKP